MRYEANKIYTYSPGLDLSNKYFEVIIECLELKMFDEKRKVIFYKNKKIE